MSFLLIAWGAMSITGSVRRLSSLGNRGPYSMLSGSVMYECLDLSRSLSSATVFPTEGQYSTRILG